VHEPVKRVATVLTVSDELLEDANAIKTYLKSRLSLFVTSEEERQLLPGAGTKPDADRLEQTGWLKHRCVEQGMPGSGRRRRRRRST